MLYLLLTCFADVLYLLLTCFTCQRAMNCYLGGMNGERADWGTAGMCPRTTIYVLIILYMCPHIYFYILVLILLYISLLIHSRNFIFLYQTSYEDVTEADFFFTRISSAQLLHECLELSPDDGPCKAILSYVESTASADGRAPSSWQGFRALTEK